MSVLVDFVVPYVDKIQGLREVLRMWAGEVVSVESPCYVYEAIRFNLVPMPDCLKDIVPISVRGIDRCLELDESLVLDWERRALSQESERSLRAFAKACSAAGAAWAVIYDPCTGPVTSTIVDCGAVYDQLAVAVERRDLTRGVQVFSVSR